MDSRIKQKTYSRLNSSKMKVKAKNSTAVGNTRISALQRLSKPNSSNNSVHQRLSVGNTSTITDARELLSNRNKPVFDARQLLSRQTSATKEIRRDVEPEEDIPTTIVLQRSANGRVSRNTTSSFGDVCVFSSSLLEV